MRRFLKGFWEWFPHSLKRKSERCPYSFTDTVLYKCDAPNCRNHKGRWAGNSHKFTMAEQKDEKKKKIWALYEVKIAESINPGGLPTQLLILWKEINSPSSFSLKHPNSYCQGSCLHIFLLHPEPNNCSWVQWRKGRVVVGKWMDWVGQKKDKKYVGYSAGPVLHCLLSL